MENQAETGQAKTCGNCFFGKPNVNDMKQVICFGVPPTPCITGGRPLPNGQVQFHVETLRPMLKRTEPACALWRAGESTLILGQTGQA